MPTIFAPAKLNLYLHVTGRREDGYHLLDSLVAFADAGDRLDLNESDVNRLTLSGPMAASLAQEAPEKNLAMRALDGFTAVFGSMRHYHIALDKNLPMAAGLGGGSADAAAILRGLASLHGVSLQDLRLRALALSLGADVPVCLDPRPAYFSGIGEVVTKGPALPQKTGLLLVNPRVPTATPVVFRAFREGGSVFADIHAPLTAADTSSPEKLAEALSERQNTLTAPAIKVAPVIATVLEDLGCLPECLLARMLGSGSSCIGLFPSLDQASDAAGILAARHPDWWIVAASFYDSAK